jgi:hypothetical protein
MFATRGLLFAVGPATSATGGRGLELKQVKEIRTGHVVWEAATGRVGEVVKPRKPGSAGEDGVTVKWNDDGAAEVLDRTYFYGSNKVDWIISREPGLFQRVEEETMDNPAPW